MSMKMRPIRLTSLLAPEFSRPNQQRCLHAARCRPIHYPRSASRDPSEGARGGAQKADSPATTAPDPRQQHIVRQHRRRPFNNIALRHGRTRCARAAMKPQSYRWSGISGQGLRCMPHPPPSTCEIDDFGKACQGERNKLPERPNVPRQCATSTGRRATSARTGGAFGQLSAT